jgi:hypothetical protein
LGRCADDDDDDDDDDERAKILLILHRVIQVALSINKAN